jgi:hypothetical protein
MAKVSQAGRELYHASRDYECFYGNWLGRPHTIKKGTLYARHFSRWEHEKTSTNKRICMDCECMLELDK